MRKKQESETKDRLMVAEDISAIFQAESKKVYRLREMDNIVTDFIENHLVDQDLSTHELIGILEGLGRLKKIRLNFSTRPEIRYVWGSLTLYQLLMQLRPLSYFSHYTAVYLNGLTEQYPKTIYWNDEQKPKNLRASKLKQPDVDRAFSGKQRMSNNSTVYEDQRIILINGKYSDNLGVIDHQLSSGEVIRTTNLERTLIDITVRPAYSGGVHEVLKAYRIAAERISLNRLVAILKGLEYMYPYHQAIGFYLERTEHFQDSKLAALKELGMEYDFYLSHAMKDTEYSNTWKIHYPRGF